MAMRKIIFLVILGVFYKFVSGLSCVPCAGENRCPETKCPGTKFLDECGCCFICAKQENEICGGPFGIYGVCDTGLTCRIDSENAENETERCYAEDCNKSLYFGCNLVDGYCKCGVDFACSNPFLFSSQHTCQMQKSTGDLQNLCDDVTCPLHSLINCPWDSELVEGRAAFGECCPPPSFCQCKSLVCALNSVCRPGTKKELVRHGTDTPGSCCDEYECRPQENTSFTLGCIVNGTHYDDKEYYQPGGCQTCQCRGGISHCEPVHCPKLPCTQITWEKGGCCPICVEDSEITTPDYKDLLPVQRFCFSDDGHSYAVGQNWTSDECTMCTCKTGGEIQCKAAFCHEPPVISSTFPCSSMSNCPLRLRDCPNGLDNDSMGCPTCRCKNDFHSCPILTGCRHNCQRGYVTNDEGCITCRCKKKKCNPLPLCRKECPYGYKKNKKGCERCRCKNCPPVTDCMKKCSDGYAKNEYGCKICRCRGDPDMEIARSIPSQSCFDNLSSRHRDDGEYWSSGCYICICRGGHVMCDLLKCPIPTCENPTKGPNSCCPICPDQRLTPASTVQSLSCHAVHPDWLVEGVTWKINQCTLCTCHSGVLMCTAEVCPPVPCDNPVYTEGACCPQCLAPQLPTICYHGKPCDRGNGSIYESESEYNPDSCTSCICRDGLLKCYSHQCPLLLNCAHLVVKRGQCCPQCLDNVIPEYNSCAVDGEVWSHGAEWNRTSGGCLSCVCVNGSVKCREPCCSLIPESCDKIITPEGACCPVCIEEEDPVSINPLENPDTSQSPISPVIVVACAVFLLLVIMILLLWNRKRFACSRTKGSYTPSHKVNVRL